MTLVKLISRHTKIQDQFHLLLEGEIWADTRYTTHTPLFSTCTYDFMTHTITMIGITMTADVYDYKK